VDAEAWANKMVNYGCAMYGTGIGYGILGWTIYLLFAGLAIAGIYWFIKSANQKNNRR
jgi:hypothetical protein